MFLLLLYFLIWYNYYIGEVIFLKIIEGSNVIYSFKPKMDSVVTVKQGEIFKVITNDCFYGQIHDESQVLNQIDYSRLNPATGPVHIEGAEPGDILKVKILSIIPTSKGVAITLPDEGVLGNKPSKSLTMILNIENGYCDFKDIKIPIKPMIGVIGVATSEEMKEIDTATPWMHGGNMDTTDICEGAVLYLPVNQCGALLALGDCHALMGDGELCFTGCEIAAEVTLQTEVIKNKNITWPIVETDDYTMVIASGDTIDEAISSATEQAVDYMMKSLRISWEEAYILSSLILDIKISQVVDPKKTVRGAIPKSILSTEKIFESL